MDRRTFIATAGSALLAAPAHLRAQGHATLRRIAFLSAFPRADVEAVLGLIRTELEKLGWIDGRNIVLPEPRTSESSNELLPSMAAEIVAQGPDLILAQTLSACRSARPSRASRRPNDCRWPSSASAAFSQQAV